MTVYVDDMLRTATVGRLRSRWSHMLADTHQQLLDMASELGLRPEWIQREGTPHEHFDLTEGKRLQALGFGAVAITYPHGTAQIIRAKRDAIAHSDACCGCHPDHHELGVHSPGYDPAAADV